VVRASFLIAFTGLIACAVAGCAQEPPRSPLPSSVEAKLIALAPAVGNSSFGPGVKVSILRPPWLFSEARVVDGTLYVTYYPQQSDRQQIAILSGGVLHPILLAQDYWALSFKNDNRVIAAGDSGKISDWYLLRGDRAIAIPRPASPMYGIPHHVLADGDTCAAGMAGSGSALDDIRMHRRVSILSEAAMSRATDGALSQAVEVSCDHFNGKNYATLDVPGVIFRLDGDNASLVSRGWIEAASDRRMLIESDKVFIDAEVATGSAERR
jgi:hypothetical protein